MDDTQLSDADIDFDSPAADRHAPPDAGASPPGSPDRPKPQRAESRYTTEEARDAALRRELEQVRGVNKVIEDVIESLEKAKNNMDTVHHTVTSASTLLQTWTRILSATEHNQRLILDPNWQGATQDLAEIEADTIAQKQAAERREREEQLRREAAIRKAEEDERRRAAEAARPGSATGTRGRRGGLRGRAGHSSSGSVGAGRTTPSGYVGVGGQRGVGRGSAASRAGSGIGRGLRGRGRA